MVRDPGRWRRTLTASAALMAFSLLLSVGGVLYFSSEKQRIRTEKEQDLEVIADQKVSQLVQWREERLGDGEVLRINRGLAEQAATVLRSLSGSRQRREMEEWARRVSDNLKYRSVVLLDTEGNPFLGAGESLDKVSDIARRAALEAVRTRRVTTVDLHVDPGGRISLDILAPLLGDHGDGVVTAVVLLRVDPNQFLYPLIQRWPTPSPTGETLLVRQEGDELVYLNEVRHVAGAALAMRRPMSTPGLVAAEGIRRKASFVEGVDYRGVPSLGAVRKVPGTSWFLVAKVDAEEVDRPTRERARTIVIILGLLLLSVGTAVALLDKNQQSRLYRRLYEAEVERQALVRHFDWLTRYANDIILLSDSEGRIVEANERALSAYGYPRDQLVGMSLGRLLAQGNEEDAKVHHERARKTDGVIYETMHRRKDGTTFPVEVSTRVTEDAGGTPTYAQDIIRDISDRKAAEAELYRTMGELERKNRELDAFARTAAHDLRQPLTVVSGYVQHLRRLLEPSLEPKHRQIFEQVLAGTSHMDRFLEDLLVLARLEAGSAPAERVSLLPLMKEIADYYKRPLAECGGSWSVAEGLPDLYLPPARAHEVFENLFSNSVKYRRPDVPLRVEVGLSASGTDAPRGFREFAFRDNGKGIAPEDQAKVFDLFYRAKEETVSGTGLGLAIVKGIVEQAGGSIRLESVPGEGTTFFFTLPVAE